MHKTNIQVGASEAVSAHLKFPVVHEGWVLKKRRKKMQGFARRYFVLHSSGTLSYSFHPGEPVRDQIHVIHAAISTAPGRKDIHIDSSNATFHIKCLNSQDFNDWMAALRKFIAADGRATIKRFLPQRPLSQLEQLNRTGTLIDELGLAINELEEALQTLPHDDTKKKSTIIKHKGEKDKHKEHGKHPKEVFALFKRSGFHPTALDSISTTDVLPFHRIRTALDLLKFKYDALSKEMNGISNLEDASVSANGFVLSSPVKAESDADPYGSAMSTPNLNKSLRASTLTSGSDVTWYDAPDTGPEEFLLEDQGISDRIDSDNRSAIEPDSTSIADTDFGDDLDALTSEQQSPGITDVTTIVRRTQLPSLPPADEGSLFAVLKKNVGKDLANVALPVTFNEPLTLLQRIAEELEYFELLTRASKATDFTERICYIAAFAVSSYAHTRFRSGRKGFNPMLAETFEDPRMKFIAEKVSHNPVVLAYHAEGEGWEIYATSAGKTKFWGKSFEIIPLGTTHVKIGEDHFEWKKPSSFMRNIMMGTKYLEHCGKMTINNVTTKARCVLDFKESGYWNSGNMVAGTVYSPSGEALVSLEGKWDETLCRKFDSSHLQVLWRVNPFPKNSLDYYGFTSFGMTLNEITEDLERKLPPTDSRYRPDVRALEEGDLDKAEAEKLRIEEAQRNRRRQGQDRQPRWFKEVGDEWIYTGEYWEGRRNGWKGIELLW